MEPTLGVGSLAIVEPAPAADLRVGDVITFSHPYAPGRLVTHRIVEVAPKSEAGGRAFFTKGDANAQRDPWTVALPDGAGRLAFELPVAGHAFVYVKTREARTVLLAAVALIVLTALLRRIWSTPTARSGSAA
jgi:signal peptidase